MSGERTDEQAVLALLKRLGVDGDHMPGAGEAGAVFSTETGRKGVEGYAGFGLTFMFNPDGSFDKLVLDE